MVFQHGPICRSADGRVFVGDFWGDLFGLVFLNFILNYTSASKILTKRLLKKCAGLMGFITTLKKLKKKKTAHFLDDAHSHIPKVRIPMYHQNIFSLSTHMFVRVNCPFIA